MLAASAEAFFTTRGDQTGIQQAAEEAPTGECFTTRDAEFLRHPIQCMAGEKGTRHTGESRGITGYEVSVGGQYGEAAAGRDCGQGSCCGSRSSSDAAPKSGLSASLKS